MYWTIHCNIMLNSERLKTTQMLLVSIVCLCVCVYGTYRHADFIKGIHVYGYRTIGKTY